MPFIAKVNFWRLADSASLAKSFRLSHYEICLQHLSETIKTSVVTSKFSCFVKAALVVKRATGTLYIHRRGGNLEKEAGGTIMGSFLNS